MSSEKWVVFILAAVMVFIVALSSFFLKQKKAQYADNSMDISPTLYVENESDLEKYFENAKSLNTSTGTKQEEIKTCVIDGKEVVAGTVVSGETCAPIITGFNN